MGATSLVSVPWATLSEPQYADLVSRLLARLHPGAEVMDGSGGDGGRDVQIRAAGQLEINELKSFTGRVSKRSPSRRRQVEKSLAQAAKLEPAAWHLVVPINHNPSELEWFDGLKAKYPFIREWRGLTWLNAQLDAHPDLVRGALNDIGDELLDAIREHRAERDVLAGGVPDLVSRTETLAQRADEVSRDYRLEARRVNGGTEVTVSAKHDRAAEVAPITLAGTFQFPTTAEGDLVRQQVDDALAYGGDFDLSGEFVGQFTLTAPAELGISGTKEPSRLFVSSVPERLDPPILATLTVLTTAGIPQQGLEITFRERLHGRRGITLRGTDAMEVLGLTVRIDPLRRAGDITVSIRESPLGTPATALPMLRLLAAFRPPNLLRLRLHRDDKPLLETPIDGPLGDDNIRQVFTLVEQLAAVQEHTRSIFAIPTTLTAEEAAMINRAARLIAGEHVPVASGRVNFTFFPHEPGRLHEHFNGEFQLAHTMNHTTIQICGRELDLGPSFTYIRRCRLVNTDDLDQEVPDAGLTLDLDLPPGEFAYRFLGAVPAAAAHES
jgi:hypothetical protein